MTSLQSVLKDPEHPGTPGVISHMKERVELVAVYAYVLLQTIFLVAGLILVHCSSISVIAVYVITGRIFKGRPEFFGPRHFIDLD